MSHDWETGSWKDTACSFVSLIHSLGSTADSCSLWANTWPSYEFWKLMFSIKSTQEVHGEALVTNDSRPHLPADHVLCQVSLWSTCVCRVFEQQLRKGSQCPCDVLLPQTNCLCAWGPCMPAPFPTTFLPQAGTSSCARGCSWGDQSWHKRYLVLGNNWGVNPLFQLFFTRTVVFFQRNLKGFYGKGTHWQGKKQRQRKAPSNEEGT